MRLIEKLFPAGCALNRLAKTCDVCLNMISEYKRNYNNDLLLDAAWLYVYGVEKSIEKWNWNPFKVKIIVPNHPEIGRVPIDNFFVLIMVQLHVLGEMAGINKQIDVLLNDESVFQHHSYRISQELKEKLKP